MEKIITTRITTNIRLIDTKIKLLLVVLSFILVLFSVKVASAATLYFSPSSGSYTVGSALLASIYVSSSEQAMNAASGVISFPQDKLEVTSFSKTGSIFSLWVQEPVFSNSAGAVNFEGIVLNPGFTGASGKIITINFRVKTAGIALLNFSSGSVLANDGKGTNILASLGTSQFNLGGAVPIVPETTTPSAVSGTPSAPKISSPTHPAPEKWYNNPNPKFVWSAPSGITSARLLYDKNPDSLPTVTYAPAISEKQLENVEDGVWYFYVRLKNSSGWGGVSHFKFQIDTQPPEPFAIKFPDGKETDNPRPLVLFNTTDSLSGIEYYKVKIGEGDFFAVAPEIVKGNSYTLPLQAPGKRTILVQAYDKAGNYTSASEKFDILPKAPVVEKKPSPLAKIITKITSTIVLIIIAVSLLILLLLLTFVFWYLWRRFKIFREKIKKETRDVERGVRDFFELLKEDILKDIQMLKKAKSIRALTGEEQRMLEKLMKKFEAAEKFLKKEIDDIKKILQ